jgi:hypothetical protein
MNMAMLRTLWDYEVQRGRRLEEVMAGGRTRPS